MKLIPLVALVFWGSAAFSGSIYDVNGTTLGKSDSTYVPMGKTRIFADMSTTYTMPDNGTPTANAQGTCFGPHEPADRRVKA